jgi:hypothetical protein
MNGAYSDTVLGGADPAQLQSVRNTFGPTWLAKFRLEDTYLTNGQYGEYIKIYTFLEWMFQESAPVPEGDEERSHLVNRWINICESEKRAALVAKWTAEGGKLWAK